MNRRRIFCWLVSMVLCSVVGQAAAQVSQAEREALIDLYHATDGDNWHNNDGWLGEEGSECEWHGVFCLGEASGDPYVRSLALGHNGLTGNLPNTLVGLDRLSLLRLANNDITGPIPMSLAELAALNDMDLGGNRLDGPIPGELLASPAHSINLQDNQLDGYTEALEDNPLGQKVIRLTGNPITALPPASWRDTGVIARLDLDRTGLAGELDFGFHPWPGLEHLYVDDNTLTGLSGIDAGTLVDLRQFFLSGNQFINSWPVNGSTLPELWLLDLTSNGLQAPPPADLPDHPRLQELRLGDNELTGADLEDLLVVPGLRRLELNHNPLEALPATLPGEVAALLRLDLSSTGLEGNPPAWFGDLALRNLNLSGNRLGTDLEPWLAALSTGPRVRLDLSRNQFEGPLPAALTGIDFEHNTSAVAHGLNLCWNRFNEPFDAELEDFLALVHFAGSLADCNDRELADIDLTLSGSWYNPERVGKGYTIMLLDNGLLLHYWFGYPHGVDAHTDEQMWSFQVIAPDGEAAIYPPSWVPYGGRFGQGLGPGRIVPYGHRDVEMVWLADDTLNILSDWGIGGRHIIVDPPLPPYQERFDHQRLTELAGTNCDNQSPFQQYSGAWYNPDAVGEGFILEVLPDDRGLVYWFTYAPDDSGRQAWMIGDGHFEGTIIGTPPPGIPVAFIEFEALTQPVGTVLGPDFDSDAVEHVEWGSLRLEFYPHGTAHAFWQSGLGEYGEGDYPLERFARPMLAECEGDD